MKHYDGIALFSGGLDSILAARLLMEQGLSIQCLHFISPFFGKPGRVRHWEREYGLEIETVDVSDDYAALLAHGPVYGYGSVLNPCVDCKILMMRRAKERMTAYGAKFIASGEVLGQRPMSQRRDTLNVIRRDADVRDSLLRPLCAAHLDPTEAELAGLVDRSKLLGFSGRGRKDQLALAEQYGITDIPTPGGGCMLTEKENARRYWPMMEQIKALTAADFRLANVGRQLWRGEYWLSVGRNQADNEAFATLAREGDVLFKVAGFPGPLALGRGDRPWPVEIVKEAAALVASYSPKACRAYEDQDSGWSEVTVRVTRYDGKPDTRGEKTERPEGLPEIMSGVLEEVKIAPARKTGFTEPTWNDVHEKLVTLRKKKVPADTNEPERAENEGR